MTPSSPSLLFIFLLLLVHFHLSAGNPNPNPNPRRSMDYDRFSIFRFHGYDTDTPSPLPSPPDSTPPPPVTCEGGLGGSGSLDDLCEVSSSLVFSGDVFILGAGSLTLSPGVSLSCPIAGCSIIAELYGSIVLNPNSGITAGTVRLAAGNITIAGGAAVNTTGLAGDPPPETSGAGTGIHGDGGGHGGRGASCFVRDGESQDGSWGGDDYSWDSLETPASYGSKGGSTSLEEDYGGGGGGVLGLDVEDLLLVEGVVEADGGNGGPLGGGGSGGSIYIIGNKM